MNKTLWYSTLYLDNNQSKLNLEPGKSSCIYSQLIYYKGAKNVKWGKNNLFEKYCEDWRAISQRMELDSYLGMYTESAQNEFKT